jgi:hypothetical protein
MFLSRKSSMSRVLQSSSQNDQYIYASSKIRPLPFSYLVISLNVDEGHTFLPLTFSPHVCASQPAIPHYTK